MRSQKSVVLHEPFASPGDAAPKRKDGYQPLDGEPTPRHGFLLLALVATFVALLFLPEFRRGLGVLALLAVDRPGVHAAARRHALPAPHVRRHVLLAANNGALNWNTAAYLQALGAAVLALIGGPLIASIAHHRVLSFELPEASVAVPVVRVIGLSGFVGAGWCRDAAGDEPWMRRGPLTVAGHAACRRACYDFADDAGGTNACKGFAYLPYETSQGECWAYFGGDETTAVAAGSDGPAPIADRFECFSTSPTWPLAFSTISMTVGGPVTVPLEWWTLGLTIFVAATSIFLLQCLLSFVFVLGCGCGPAMWRRTRPLTDAELVELKATVATAVASQAHMYDFSMALHAAWELDCGEQRAAFDALRAEWAAQTPPRESNVRQLFHGTRMENAHGIVTGGFRLPRHSGMFGKGLYFADTPLKSLQYTGISWGWRYMLVCEVELGNSKTQRGAKDDKKEDLERGWLPTVMGQRSFQSVTAATGLGGVRVPEYVVYDASQAVPKYLLAVSEVRPSDPRALKPDGDVKVGDLKALIEMGFPEEAAKAALRRPRAMCRARPRRSRAMPSVRWRPPRRRRRSRRSRASSRICRRRCGSCTLRVW